MIVLRLAGGLGNQLFQVMAGVLDARRSQRRLVVLTGALSGYAAARQPDVLNLVSSPFLVTSGEMQVPAHVSWLALRGRAGRWLAGAVLNDRNFPGALGNGSWAGGWRFLDGYFQRGWNQALLDEALSAVQMDTRAMKAPVSESARWDCVVHIRGGDFLHLRSHAIVDIDYYSRCLELAKADGCRSFGVVTDDRSHAQALLRTLSARHGDLTLQLAPDRCSALDDFATLRAARARIIGNSTFAWWASACDPQRATTWAPDCFVRGLQRDFALPWERVVTTGLLPGPRSS